MKNWIFAGVASAALIGAPTQAQPAHSLAEDAAAFGARDAVSAARLSPDGSSVMYITPGPGPKSFAIISNLQSGQSTVMTSADGDPERLRWCNYSAPDRAVCQISVLSNQTSKIVGFSRLLSMTTGGADGKLLGQRESFYDQGLRQTDALVLDWNGGRDGKVLMERVYVPEGGRAAIESRLARSKSGLGVDLVDTRTLRSTTVELPRDEASHYMTDGRGNVRIMTVVESSTTGALSGRVKYFYRTKTSRDWKPLVEFAEYDEQVRPLAIDAEIDSLYLLRKKNGRHALYAMKLDGSGAERLIAENPRVDIDGVERIGDGHRVIGYHYSDETTKTEYFDPEFKALADSLSKALPSFPIVNFVDATADGRKLLLFAGSDDDPGRYYLFDRDSKTLNEAMLDRPQLEGRKLAKVKPVSIPSADGVQIPAYLTLPPGKESARGLPAVVLPHGGPSSRDYWGFDWLSQFLAARGYAVLQPQFRGSAGFGDDWMGDNALKNWRTAMADIATSARWLGSQGIADPNRLAILGWSYGGYAALQSGVLDPDLFKAVVAVAPVTDLGLLVEEARTWSHGRVTRNVIGSGSHVREGSPAQNADRIKAPVLMFHGDHDLNVEVRHARLMEDRLKAAGKKAELVVYPGLDHQLEDSAARQDLLKRSDAFLRAAMNIR